MRVSWAVGLWLAAWGCGDDASSSGGGAQGGGPAGGAESVGGAGGPVGGGGAGAGGVGGDGGGGAPSALHRLRFAHLSPDAATLDLCLIDAASDVVGPLFGGGDALVFPSASGYLDVPAATVVVRLVDGATGSCDEALAELPARTLAPGASSTLAAVGSLGSTPALGIRAFDDEVVGVPGEVRQRFVHAIVDATPPSIDLGLGAGAEFEPLWTDVAFGEVGLVDGQPYLVTEPLNLVTMTLRDSVSGEDLLSVENISIPPGEIVTSFAVGELGGATPLQVLACLDLGGFCIEFPFVP